MDGDGGVGGSCRVGRGNFWVVDSVKETVQNVLRDLRKSNPVGHGGEFVGESTEFCYFCRSKRGGWGRKGVDKIVSGHDDLVKVSGKGVGVYGNNVICHICNIMH